MVSLRAADAVVRVVKYWGCSKATEKRKMYRSIAYYEKDI